MDTPGVNTLIADSALWSPDGGCGLGGAPVNWLWAVPLHRGQLRTDGAGPGPADGAGPAARYERRIARSPATLLPATQRPPVNQASKAPKRGNPAGSEPAAAKHAASQAPGAGHLVGSRASLTGVPKKWTEQPIPSGPSGARY